jgi:hypothetical protein
MLLWSTGSFNTVQVDRVTVDLDDEVKLNK